VGGRDADYTTIQEAINVARNGATIFIKNGSYNELLVINKTLTLRGEDKNTTILHFNPDYEITTQISLVNITADNCLIENLQITQGNKSRFLGIETEGGGCCGEPAPTQITVFVVRGISVTSKNNTIKNTIITNVSKGIELYADSASNTILYNEIKNNQIGIETVSSVNNIITHNILSHNQQYNMYVMTDSDTNTISFNRMDTSIYGIRIKESQHNNVYNNCINNNDVGIYCCCDALSNSIYRNTLFNNTLRNAVENEGLTNIWYDSPTGTGNYWDDYNGSDANHDGIGDTAYEINGSKNQDVYPLMNTPIDAPCNP